ncbi:MAG: hypothetical protein Q9160_005982 [Pyrenula sp. 1 TL-2023]
MKGRDGSMKTGSSTALYLPQNGVPHTIEVPLPSSVIQSQFDEGTPFHSPSSSSTSPSPTIETLAAQSTPQAFTPPQSSSYIPGPGESLVRVHYSGINPADLKHRTYGVFNTIPGYDFSGTIVATCPGSPFRIGDKIGGTAPAGIVDVGVGRRGESEGEVEGEGGRKVVHAAHQDWLVGVDDLMWKIGDGENASEGVRIRDEGNEKQDIMGMSLAEAAGIGIPLRTAIVALYADLNLPFPWEHTVVDSDIDRGLLIWGAGSQVGGWAVQLAAASNVSPIYAVANLRHHNKLRAFGAARCFEYDAIARGGKEVISNVMTAAREDGIVLRKAFDAVGCGRAESISSPDIRTSHMAEHCDDILRALNPGAEFGESLYQVATVLAGGPPNAIVTHAMPDRDVEFDVQGKGKVLLERHEERAESVLLVIDWIVQNYGRPMKVPGKVNVVDWDSAADEIVRIGAGKGQGGEKIIIRHIT